MGNVIHGASHKALKFMREHPATLAVYWVYLSRANYENVAYPSIRGLAQETGWSAPECERARNWLVEHQALDRVEGYTRPDWRELSIQDRTRRMNFDKSEYYRPTGRIVIENVIYPMLYFGAQEKSTVEEQEIEPTSDVQQGLTSNTVGYPTGIDIQQCGTELNTKEIQLNTTEKKPRKKRADSGVPKERKPIERSDVFKVVARESFKILDVDTIDGNTVTRINKILKWLRENSPNATAQTVTEFYRWYDRETKNRLSRPRDDGKFGEHFAAFRDQYRAQQERKTVNISDFSAWRLEEMKQNAG